MATKRPPSRPIALVQPLIITKLVKVFLPRRLEQPTIDWKLIEHVRCRYFAQYGPLPR